MRFVKLFLLLILLSANAQHVLSQLTNDLCSSALDIHGFIIQNDGLSGPYSNVGATGNDVDVADVTGCWFDPLSGDIENGTPQVDATVWFRFEGFDGNLALFVQPCDSNLSFLSQDTQMVLFKGECDSLEVVACNEDINAAANYYWSGISTEIQAGTDYYLAVDGFNYSGFGSPELPLTTGEFCLSTQQPEVAVTEISSAQLSAFPNPSDGMITLQTDAPVVEVNVYNMVGTRCGVYANSGSSNNPIIELPDSSGVYLLHVKTKHGEAFRRVIRN
jgi:hypothetical protein